MNIFTGLQAPKVIYETNSKFNGNIKVVEYGSVRRILVGNIAQSITHTALSTSRLYWGKTVKILKENFTSIPNILLLGLGGGTLVHLISKEFPDTQITSVDIDQTMVDIAKNYFDIDSIKNHRIIVEDALRVVVEPNEFGFQEFGFTVVIVDIYIGETYPDLGKSGNFIAAIRSLVAPGGMVIFNRIYRDEQQEEVNTFIEYVSGFFSNVKNLVVAGYTNSDNVLIYAKV